MENFAKKQFLVCNFNILLLAGAYFVYGFLMQIGVDQIRADSANSLSQVHAGDNEINCKYCHSSARVRNMRGFLL
jgi:hypothetical protein